MLVVREGASRAPFAGDVMVADPRLAPQAPSPSQAQTERLTARKYCASGLGIIFGIIGLTIGLFFCENGPSMAECPQVIERAALVLTGGHGSVMSSQAYCRRFASASLCFDVDWRGEKCGSARNFCSQANRPMADQPAVSSRQLERCILFLRKARALGCLEGANILWVMNWMWL